MTFGDGFILVTFFVGLVPFVNLKVFKWYKGVGPLHFILYYFVTVSFTGKSAIYIYIHINRVFSIAMFDYQRVPY